MSHNVVGKCALCGIETDLTKHHLIPQLKCKNKYKELKDDPENHLWICEECHSHIHSMFTENELRDVYNTKEALMSNEEFRKFVEWRSKHPNFTGTSKMSNNRKRR